MNTWIAKSYIQLQNFYDDDSIINFIPSKRKPDPFTIKNLEEIYQESASNVGSLLLYYITSSSKVDIYKRYPD